MRTKPWILVVDDDPDTVLLISDILQGMSLGRISTADNEEEALKKASEEKPDLIILDIELDKAMSSMEGLKVIQRLRNDPDPNIKRILILVLTQTDLPQDQAFKAGANEYIAKLDFKKDDFKARVKEVLERAKHPPFDYLQDDTTLSITCKPGKPINISSTGEINFDLMGRVELDIDKERFARGADEIRLSKSKWRYKSKEMGERLFEKIIRNDKEILAIYNYALGSVRPYSRLHIRFKSERDFLRVPLESLYDKSKKLVLRHPLARSISDVLVNRKPPSPDFFNKLYKSGEELKILLIASNTLPPPIPGVDHEVEVLGKSLEDTFGNRGIKVKIKAIPTEYATYDSVKEALEKCPYHILHYAGHGNYNTASPEESYLSFWEKEGCQGKVEKLKAAELESLLPESNLRFVYLSCCLGAKTGGNTKLMDDDFLGIADSIILSGIPSVLGYRWPVSDDGAETLALAFYDSLAKQGQIDTALLDARNKIAGPNKEDITWLSPILIMQA